jgi:hypothetical protein
MTMIFAAGAVDALTASIGAESVRWQGVALLSVKIMRVTGTDSNLSPSGGGRSDSTLPYTVSFGPTIRI